jgi:hypothetical protein
MPTVLQNQLMGAVTVNNPDRRLWPFGSRASLVSAVVLLVGLMLLVAILRATVNWPSEKAESATLIAVLLLSLLPILLALLDVFMERGAVIEYAGVKVDFSQTRAMGTTGITVAANIGVRGRAVTDSSTPQILDAIKQAASADIAIIDLEAGEAWWETRLLVLLAGAVRLGKPSKIVFVGKDEGREQSFQGWSYAQELFPLLVASAPQYLRSLQTARAIARQWELVEPVSVTGAASVAPVIPAWLTGVAARYQWMAFDPTTGLRNELLEEQLLQSDLGEKIEQLEGSRRISLVRLEELFRPILKRGYIDRSWESKRQLDTLFMGEEPFLAVIQDGKYATLVPRLALLNQLVKPLVSGRQDK